MAFGKWNTSGELTYADGDPVGKANLNTSIAGPMVPIGSVIPWAKSITGVPQTLPSSYVECSGQVLSDADSPLNGQTIPNLNNSVYLRSNSTSGGTGGANTHNHTYTYSDDTGGSGVLGNYIDDDITETTPTVNHEPPYMTMVMIMRIK